VTLIEECRRMKIEIMPPDINRSEWKFTLEDGKIRFGLGAVRNVGANAVESVVAARAGGGAFRDLFDLACRLDARAINRRVMESLIGAGACDGLGVERGAMFAAAGRVLEQAAMLQRERQSGQSLLFGEVEEGGVTVVAPPLPAAEAWSLRDRSAREKEVLGFYFSEHPLEPLRSELQRVATHAIADALSLEDGSEVRLVGLIGSIKALTTRAGRRMAVACLEDLSGRIECTLFPDTFEAARPFLIPEELVVATGRIESPEDRAVKLLVSEIRRWEDARRIYRPSLHLEVRADELTVEWLESVDQVLSSHPGESEVYLHIIMPDRSRQACRSRRYRVAEGEAVVASIRGRFPNLRVGWGKALM
jgi:DNA polymerase-3 subunit alpha